jgi:hypothetical protein
LIDGGHINLSLVVEARRDTARNGGVDREQKCPLPLRR